MKKTLCIIVIVSMLLIPFSIPASASTVEYPVFDFELDDLFNIDFELTNDEVARFLMDSHYEAKSSNCVLQFYITYTIPEAEYCFMPGSTLNIDDYAYDSFEEIEAVFFDNLGLNQEYIGFAYDGCPFWFEYDQCLKTSTGKYYAITYHFKEYGDAFSSFDPVDRAFCMAKIIDVIGFGEHAPEGYTGYRGAMPGGSYLNIIRFDANYDGIINAKDKLFVKRAIAGEDFKYNSFIKSACADGININDNFGVLNSKDSFYIQTYINTGIDLEMPYNYY